MARQSSTEVKLQFICEKISKLEKGQEELRADINRGKGGLLVLLFIGTLISGLYNYFK
jgi:hypothetical protein